MNYIVVHKSVEDAHIPCPIVQAFTDYEMFLLHDFIEDALDRDIYEPGTEVARRFMDVIKQWEVRSL